MEYVKLNPGEQTYVKKNLLHAEMEILQILSRYQKFRKLRAEELALKSLLRRRVSEIHEELKILDKVLPRAPVEEKPDKSFEPPIQSPKKRRDLQIEIDEIKRKIARLQ